MERVTLTRGQIAALFALRRASDEFKVSNIGPAIVVDADDGRRWILNQAGAAAKLQNGMSDDDGAA